MVVLDSHRNIHKYGCMGVVRHSSEANQALPASAQVHLDGNSRPGSNAQDPSGGMIILPGSSRLALVADTFGEGAGALAGDVHEAGVSGNLVEHG
jgi:hypothetical protein